MSKLFEKKKKDVKEFQRKPCWTEILSSVSSFVMVIISLFGLLLVLQEIRNLQEQNSYLNRSLMQSYRPLGIFKPKDKGNRTIYVTFVETITKEKISFNYEQDFSNKGTGILFLTGYIYYITENYIDFRKSLLSNEIKKVEPDEIFPYTRNYPINPGEKILLPIMYRNIEMKKKYYLYIIAFYKDQDQNLYDTQQLTVMSLTNPISNTKGFIGKFDQKSGGSLHENYHLYKPEERKNLIEQTRLLNLPISNYLFGPDEMIGL